MQNKVIITPSKNPEHKSGYQEPMLAFRYDEEGLPVYPEHKYFSSLHDLVNTLHNEEYLLLFVRGD